jgi:hypothetical protein
MKKRLDTIEKSVRRLSERRPGSPRAILTSDERRKRAAWLILKAKLGRPPTVDEVSAFRAGGGIVASIDAAFCDRRIEEAKRKGDARGVERWRGIAAGLERLRAARERNRSPDDE